MRTFAFMVRLAAVLATAVVGVTGDTARMKTVEMRSGTTTTTLTLTAPRDTSLYTTVSFIDNGSISVIRPTPTTSSPAEQRRLPHDAAVQYDKSKVITTITNARTITVDGHPLETAETTVITLLSESMAPSVLLTISDDTFSQLGEGTELQYSSLPLPTPPYLSSSSSSLTHDHVTTTEGGSSSVWSATTATGVSMTYSAGLPSSVSEPSYVPSVPTTTPSGTTTITSGTSSRAPTSTSAPGSGQPGAGPKTFHPPPTGVVMAAIAAIAFAAAFLA